MWEYKTIRNICSILESLAQHNNWNSVPYCSSSCHLNNVRSFLFRLNKFISLYMPLYASYNCNNTWFSSLIFWLLFITYGIVSFRLHLFIYVSFRSNKLSFTFLLHIRIYSYLHFICVTFPLNTYISNSTVSTLN